MKFMQLIETAHENTINLFVFLNQNKKRIELLIFLSIPIMAIVYFIPIESKKWTTTIAGVIGIICILLWICISLPKVFISFRYFLTVGIGYSICISSMIYLWYSEKAQTISIVWEYLVFSVINLVMWSLFSIMANCKVSTLTNVILTALLGINEAIFDFIMGFLPDTPFTFVTGNEIIKKEHIEAVFNIITTPLVITNITATVLCAIKLYWIEKYADGLDLTQELLEETDNNTQN